MIEYTTYQPMTQKEAILWLLRSGPKSTSEMCSPWFRSDRGKAYSLARELSARMSDLRRDGYLINFERKTEKYSLVAEPDLQGQITFSSA
jgi:hypothetical protein